MTAPFAARRRADEFEALLSRRPGTPLTDDEAARYADLLRVVSDLRSVPDVAARPEFVSSLRERLMAEADTVLVPRPSAPARLAMPAPVRTRQRRLGAVLGGAALVGAAATMAVAAQTALPGESLYGVKRGIESAQVRLADDDAARGRTLLAQADTRLDEIEEIADGEGGREQLVPDTLEDFTQQSSEGVRSILTAYDAGGAGGAEADVQADVEAAREFTATSMGRLVELEDQLPLSAREDLVAAGRTLSDLDLEVSSACGGCEGGITTTPEFLLTSAGLPTDLLTGLDTDEATLEAAPVSGQDLTGLEVPPELGPPPAGPTDVPGTATTTAPTTAPTPGATTGPTTGPTTPAPTTRPGLPTQTPSPVLPIPTQSVPTTRPDPTQGVKELTQGVTGTVTSTTGDLASQLNGVTGGALGGLTSDVDDATGGLISEVTGTLNGLTGLNLGNATGGLLPGPNRP
ncbi:DUF5667 domain-containing protein [Nocardioides sp. S-58]|uniref:DUF5667 domain-containing protein n=1 Tax=Nocardioides renjunii TaxID=3095075 RepID=A0ABU5KE43_9ACTN|nr:DUF5667 domain-containing protein [Nocardioides sp. S-58]MDZ5663240.1 DUF5667 domain-containing protein [Nocardioides sp. S-58]